MSRPLEGSMMKVRPFEAGDLPGAALLADLLRAEDRSVEPFGDQLGRLWNGGRARRALWRAAVDADARLCGISFALERSPGELDVYGAVRSDLRRHRLGTKLLEPALREAAAGRAALHAQVREPSPGRAFLEKHGFVFEGRTLLLERAGSPALRGGPRVRAITVGDAAERDLLLSVSAAAYAGAAEGFPLTAADVERFGPPHGLAVVAERAGAAVGYLVGRTMPGTVAVEEIGVLPDARRQGIGTALLAEAMRIAAASSAVLAVDQANRAGRAFYAAAGFRQSGARTRFVLR